eukprot:scaffold18664_cov67-Isochrysis_galbana.AAC.1
MGRAACGGDGGHGGGNGRGASGVAPPPLPSFEALLLPALDSMLSRLFHLNRLATAHPPSAGGPTPDQQGEGGVRSPPEEEVVAVSTALQALSCWVSARRWLNRLLSERSEQ